MVIVEVPLWVVHKSGESLGVGSVSSAAARSGNYNHNHSIHTLTHDASSSSSQPTSSSVVLEVSNDSDAMRAKRTVELWQATSRCPVYAVDSCGPYFCTAGGDGTVRVWRLSGLFQQQQVRPLSLHPTRSSSTEPPVAKAAAKVAAAAVAGIGAVNAQGEYVFPQRRRRRRKILGTQTNHHTQNVKATATSRKKWRGPEVSADELSDSSASSSSSSSSSTSSSSSSSTPQTQSSSGDRPRRYLPPPPSSNHQEQHVHDLTRVVRKKTQQNKDTILSGGENANSSASLLLPTLPDQQDNHIDPLQEPMPPPPLQQPHPQHRLVASLTGHSGHSVLCARFSNHGRWIATGGDDGLVLIYRTSIIKTATTNATTSTASSANANSAPLPITTFGLMQQQYWPRAFTCNGHSLDVIDLCWSPDDSFLVSCSFDSNRPILVWKIPSLSHTPNHHHNRSSNNPHHPLSSMTTSIAHQPTFLAPYKTLASHHHTSTVRGVTFDPAGSYLASSGDDPAVCIWRAHDDWGLEKRITEIFHRPVTTNTTTANTSTGSSTITTTNTTGKWSEGVLGQNSGGGSGGGPTLVRRLSWSTDGAYVACTNGVVQNKHVVSTITRQGWAVAGNQPSSGGGNTSESRSGANLVGHKVPVVVCRHCPILLDTTTTTKDQPQQQQQQVAEPKYATLLALGDKSGFVTVWTTQQSRPVFKIQCASRTTVTDMTWSVASHHDDFSSINGGVVVDHYIALLVSQLDGAVTVLHFQKGELPPLLSPAQQAAVFSLKYGIEDGFSGIMTQNASQSSNLMESARSWNMYEDDASEMEDKNDNEWILPMEEDVDDPSSLPSPSPPSPTPTPIPLHPPAITTAAGGKKRVRPVLLSIGEGGEEEDAAAAVAMNASSEAIVEKSKSPKSGDPVQDAIEAARKASSVTSVAQSLNGGDALEDPRVSVQSPPGSVQQQHLCTLQVAHSRADPNSTVSYMVNASQFVLSHNAQKIQTICLPLVSDYDNDDDNYADVVRHREINRVSIRAECLNSNPDPNGNNADADVRCDLVIKNADNAITWRDHVYGTHASDIAATSTLLVLGTTDGVLYLYGTSPTMGWKSCQAFRSLPPLIIGHPIVNIRVKETRENKMLKSELLVLASDGIFAVYNVHPLLNVQYKGSILPALTHMALSCKIEYSHDTDRGKVHKLPSLSRIQFSETPGRLILLLGFENVKSTTSNEDSRLPSVTPICVGGSLQGFAYNRPLELWTRIADSRFLLSDFYSGLPSKSKGKLTRVDDLVRMGSVHSSSRASHGSGSSQFIFQGERNDPRLFMTTRAHCEDRMACALMMESPQEFKQWLGMYVRALSLAGQTETIRLLVDMLMGACNNSTIDNEKVGSSWWWLSRAPDVLMMDGKNLCKTVILPELRKNVALQRLTNEIHDTMQEL